jgi:hypothetical protein
MISIGPPVLPYRGTRDTDAYGSGTFLASRDGGIRSHRGRDYITVVDDPILSPIDGVVTRIPRAYADANLTGIEIESDRIRVKLLYVTPIVAIGAKVRRGQMIGEAQDVAGYWMAKQPRPTPMVNHVHLEVSVWMDPADAMETPPAPGGVA